jgi:hypothetical protein
MKVAKAVEDAKNVLSELNVVRAPERRGDFMLQYDFIQETPSDVAVYSERVLQSMFFNRR